MTARVEMQAAWDQHEGLVIGTACKFYRDFGGDLLEITADARYLFVTACQTYEEAAPLGYWIRRRVWWGLIDERRQKLRRGKHEQSSGSLPEQWYKDDFDHGRWNVLSEDAKEVVETALQPPPDVLCLRPERSCKDVSRHMIERFYLDCGWTRKRVRKAFKEVEQLIA